MSRAFRARPLDVNKQLELILDINELDSAEGLPARDVVHNHAQLDADNEKARLHPPSRGWVALLGGCAPAVYGQGALRTIPHCAVCSGVRE